VKIHAPPRHTAPPHQHTAPHFTPPHRTTATPHQHHTPPHRTTPHRTNTTPRHATPLHTTPRHATRRFDPLNLGGLIQLRKAKDKPAEGPLVDIQFKWTEMGQFRIEIYGFAKFLFFETDIQISINAKVMSIDVSTNLPPLFLIQARIHIFAAITQEDSKKLGGRGFEASVVLSMQPVIDAVILMVTTFKKMFDAAFEIAMSALERAQLALESAKCHIDRTCESCKLEMSAVVLLNLPEDRKNFLMGKGPLHNGSAPQGLIQFVSMEEYLIVKTHLE